MTIHHQAHQERVDAELGFEWDTLPPFVEDVSQISLGAAQVRLCRVAKSHRGISNLSGVKKLWAHGVTQDFLHEISALKDLEVLYMEKVTAVDLSAVNALPLLRSLSVIDAPKITNLSWLPMQPTLRSLAIENAKAIHDLAPLSQLTHLTALGIEGSVLTPMLVSSLEPISTLRRLRFLFMTNLRAKDESLAALLALPKLQVLQCAKFFPVEEFSRLASANPGLRCDWLSAKHWSATA
jgi:hypothetical protein